MIRRLVPLLIAIGGAIVLMATPEAAWAEKRVALIVGNSNYQTVPQLPNPSKDANAIAKMLREAGFDSVDVQLNVGNLEFKRAIRKFEASADQADIAVVYYAGHGLEIGGSNYLIPVDAKLASDRDADDEAILLDRLVSSVDGAKRLRLVVLDACRDNPFIRSMRRERKTASRGLSSGLGKIEPTSTDTLIAYAAKAGSTAEDGIGENSPFTTAVLKNLSVPGLDIRLAFGRVRDEVMKATGNRQEPFVYGSLGGGNIALVPAPAVPVPVEASQESDVKADYDLVQRIGTVRAWEVFLGSHPTGFHAELARAQIDALKTKSPGGPANPPNIVVADLPAAPRTSERGSSSAEALEWEKIKDSTDPAALQKFIKRFPNAPLAINAQQRLDLLQKAAEERQEQARIEREAAAEAKRQAAQRKAELAAAKKLEEEARRAKEAEAVRSAKAAAAELAAAKKREDEERHAKAVEAEQKAKAAEAERKAADAKQRAEQASREKSAAEAAAARAASDREAKQAESARKQAEVLTAKEGSCKSEETRLDAINAKGSQGSGLSDLTAFAKTITCDRLKGVASATLERFKVESAQNKATEPNSPELVRSAQAELIRIGCLSGNIDGKLNDATVAALSRYMTIEKQPADKVLVTDGLIYGLTKHTDRVCPVECKSGETLKGEICIANEKPKAAKPIASRKNDDEPRRKQQSAHKPERAEPRRAAKTEAPRARQQAAARPSSGGGGGRSGGGGGAIIGVGF